MMTAELMAVIHVSCHFLLSLSVVFSTTSLAIGTGSLLVTTRFEVGTLLKQTHRQTRSTHRRRFEPPSHWMPVTSVHHSSHWAIRVFETCVVNLYLFRKCPPSQRLYIRPTRGGWGRGITDFNVHYFGCSRSKNIIHFSDSTCQCDLSAENKI